MIDFSTPDISVLSGDPAPVRDGSAAGVTTRADAVLSERHDWLMGRPGVVSIGRGRDAIGNDAIVVGVKRPDQRAGLPAFVDAVPVVTEVIGEVDALPDTGSR